tara:strand:- start:975 stop:1673 length:699 start_codon:yes stop_codon:yes gene_type:complete
MCGPVPIVMSVLSAGLSIMQQTAATRAQNAQIDFQNQVAEQEFQYNTLQAQSARTNQEQQRQLQEDVITQNFELANLAYESDIAALNLRLMQEDAAAGTEKRKTSLAALQAKGEVVAAGRVGNSIQNLIADVQRQQAAFDYATDMNLAFVGKQLQEQKRGAGVQRASRIASQQPYLKQTILDPMKPIKRQHVKGPGMLGILNAGLSGAQAGFTASSGIKAGGGKVGQWNPWA